MVNFKATTAIVTLIISGLNSPIKMQTLSNCIKSKTNYKQNIVKMKE